jgi:NADH:ubiquinone oxidoreductase subunit C
MNAEELKHKVTELCPSATYDETGEFLTTLIAAPDLLPLMQQLATDKDLHFDFLFCLTCIDWKDHFMMVYHLRSTDLNHCLVVKAKIADTTNPEIESVNDIWRTAEFHEDEVYDMFGVKFLNHPNLRRLFLEADWNGFPLRKNYTDENMIKL